MANQLQSLVLRDDVLHSLPLAELYSRAFFHFSSNHFNVLLLAALVQAAAMDVVLSECGRCRLLASLQGESEAYKGKMLLFLVGRAWQVVRVKGDASGICVKSLTDQWREYSEHL